MRTRLRTSPISASPLGLFGKRVGKFVSASIGLGLFACLLFAVSISGSAQVSTNATLRGTVKDPNGAVVSKATVTLISDRTQSTRKSTTNSDGNYAFVAVDPGNYSVKVEAGGFKTLSQTGVALSPSDNKGLDLVLEVGATSETVTITGLSEEIKTETGEKSNTINAKQIENLSIIGRNSLELLRILPGVVAPDQSSYQISSFGDASGYNVNGQRGNNNNVSVDGSRVIDIGCNCGSIVSMNNDMVQEVTVQTSNYAAEHGNSSVQISAVTKGGGRDYHGSVYNYTRHDALAANDRFRNYLKAQDPTALAAAKPPGRFYYTGGNIGGPVTLPKKVFGPLGGFNEGRDKLFFFVGFEEQRQSFGADPKQAVVPTLKERAGDFSDLLTFPGSHYNQDVNTDPVTGKQYALRIPAGFANAGQPLLTNNLAPYINPYGKALINLYPLPNFNDPAGRYNYIANPVQFLNRKDLKMRFDYKVSDKTSIYVRITREKELQDGAYGLWWGASTYELPSHNQSINLGRSVAVGITKVINPTMTNEFVFSGSKLKLDNNFADPEKIKLSSLGLQNLKLPFDKRFGRQSEDAPLNLISWAQGSLWALGTAPIFAYNDSFSASDNVAKVISSHTLKFGAVVEQGNKVQNFQDESSGRFELSRWNSNGTGNEWGDLLAGQLNTVWHDKKIQPGNFRFYNYEFYAQDSWKMRSNLTLEYGLRASHMTLNKERKGFDVLFSPEAYKKGAGYYINGDPFSPNGILSAARGQIPKGGVSPPAIELAPRLNFAWDVKGTSDLVIRGGAGIFYNRVQGNAQYDATLRSATNGNVTSSFGTGATIRGSGNPAIEGKTFNDIGGLTFDNLSLLDPLLLQSGGGDILVPNPDSVKFPTTYNMSLSIAKRLPFQSVLEVSYVSTLSRHLGNRRNINFVPKGILLTGAIPGDPGSTITTLANPNCDPTKAGDCKIVTQTGVKADLTNPLVRASLDGSAINKFRPYPDLGTLRYQEYTGTSNYHSLQATLSRQLGKNFQFYGTYTFSKVLGTLAGDGQDVDPLDSRGRTFGVLDYDRTHVFNLSYNYNVPDLARGSFKNPLTSGVLNGWQMSGITTWTSGTPIRLRFSGDIVSDQTAIAAFGSNAFAVGNNQSSGAITPVYLKDPRLDGSKAGERFLDLSAIGFPSFGTSGPTVSPLYIRTPNRQNWDLSLFKNFKVRETKTLQFRAGFFNLFNQAFPKRLDNGGGDSDIFLALQTECNSKTPVAMLITNADGTTTSFTQTIANGAGGTAQGVCDPSKGYKFSSDTQNRFGKIVTKRGQRVVELALKFTF